MLVEVEYEVDAPLDPGFWYTSSFVTMSMPESPSQSTGSNGSSNGSPELSSPPFSSPGEGEENEIPYLPEFQDASALNDDLNGPCYVTSSWMCMLDLDTSSDDVVETTVPTNQPCQSEAPQKIPRSSYLPEPVRNVCDRGIIPLMLEWLSPRPKALTTTKYHLPLDDKACAQKFRTRRRDRLTPRLTRMLPLHQDDLRPSVLVCLGTVCFVVKLTGMILTY